MKEGRAVADSDVSACASKRAPQPRVVYTPLKRKKCVTHDPFCRAENEDDDGYDPYSDRPVQTERPGDVEDPWR